MEIKTTREHSNERQRCPDERMVPGDLIASATQAHRTRLTTSVPTPRKSMRFSRDLSVTFTGMLTFQVTKYDEWYLDKSFILEK
ncbi:hypothetical protein PABG_11425 [Paracoccidioides brasiliensis Pb03]|uniref:Uncharacterized protein n=2 Tax=Paracoccidioides brasiliensis TaxID=121759 RepID=A0A0A0HSA6_PARBD|nr:uncharacterized protein PADG_11629 [Paracoccidioides brasiliensis Pb18]KGM92099.1 hypothetical protein PADG_11629 [Paracoccidioides brasiliensis Pb18]KGY15764.1 hypothetical protein PABG_11425 [Paracoccidioides brasiliensis Pb03]ODH45302.1 hypothetical protein ACO22_00180 [Paracoccidioides brasiliensis]ODH48774.1 hypothetical protein GX48_05099 [Paracoccidioides brasiliensis]